MTARTGEIQATARGPIDFTNAVILRNPGSTKIGTPEGERALSAIQINWPGSNIYDVLPRDPSQPDHDPSEQLVQEMIEEASNRTYDPNVLVIVLGGDGTAATAARAIAGINKGRPADERRHAMVVVPGGNGNILAAMLNGNGQRSPVMPRQLTDLGKGIIRDVPLLEMTIITPQSGTENEANNRTRYGIIGAGLGLTATYAEVINSAKYRSMPGYRIPLVRAGHELASVLALLRNIDKEKIDVGIWAQDVDSGALQRFVSLDIINGRLYAKVISREESEQSLFESQATEYMLPDEAYLADWAYAVQVGDWPTQTITTDIHRGLRVIGDTPAQIDGECFTIPAKSAVRIQVAHDMAARVLAHKSTLQPRHTRGVGLTHRLAAELTRAVVAHASPDFRAPGPRPNNQPSKNRKGIFTSS